MKRLFFATLELVRTRFEIRRLDGAAVRNECDTNGSTRVRYYRAPAQRTAGAGGRRISPTVSVLIWLTQSPTIILGPGEPEMAHRRMSLPLVEIEWAIEQNSSVCAPSPAPGRE